MSELAFNANGESFEIPATVTGWRVRRMKPRGAPELVYGKDGRPLTLGIEADIDELRDAVGSAGKYRLDPINDDGKCVENVPAAYVHVVKPQRNGVEQGVALAAPAPSDDTLREAMRLNTELAKSVIDRFPEMMTAAAELLRAADGAGLPRRAPRDAEEDDEEEVTVAPASPSFEFINNLIAQVIPLVVTGLAGKKMKLSSVLDWRKASAEAHEEKQTPALGTSTTTATTQTKENTPAAEALPPIDPQTMAHFIAIQSALKPEEAALARQVASELAPAELRAWFDELSKLSVPQAVQKIRVLIAGNTEAVS
jgi:hypothetical protein